MSEVYTQPGDIVVKGPHRNACLEDFEKRPDKAFAMINQYYQACQTISVVLDDFQNILGPINAPLPAGTDKSTDLVRLAKMITNFVLVPFNASRLFLEKMVEDDWLKTFAVFTGTEEPRNFLALYIVLVFKTYRIAGKLSQLLKVKLWTEDPYFQMILGAQASEPIDNVPAYGVVELLLRASTEFTTTTITSVGK